MSKQSTNDTKENNCLESKELEEKSDEKPKKTIETTEMTENSKDLENVSNDCFEFIETVFRNKLNENFDILSQTVDENKELIETIERTQELRLKDIILKSNLNINDKTSTDLTENDLIVESIALNSCVQSLASELSVKRVHKTELSDKTKALTRSLEQMENRVQELKAQNDCKGSQEYVTLARAMRVMYKTWNNSRVVGILFNNNEEKNLEKLIVIDRENKSEAEVAQQFWHSINTDYGLQE